MTSSLNSQLLTSLTRVELKTVCLLLPMTIFKRPLEKVYLKLLAISDLFQYNTLAQKQLKSVKIAESVLHGPESLYLELALDGRSYAYQTGDGGR